jgi:hypothetical protein
MSQTKSNKSTKVKIGKFISAVSDKKYAEANKYLQSAVEDKLIKRVNTATNKPLF